MDFSTVAFLLHTVSQSEGLPLSLNCRHSSLSTCFSLCLALFYQEAPYMQTILQKEDIVMNL